MGLVGAHSLLGDEIQFSLFFASLQSLKDSQEGNTNKRATECEVKAGA